MKVRYVTKDEMIQYSLQDGSITISQAIQLYEIDNADDFKMMLNEFITDNRLEP